jgi:hypothetical protein
VTQVRCILIVLKLPAHAQWQHWLAALQVLQVGWHVSGMLLNSCCSWSMIWPVVDLGRFSCISRLAAWQQSTEPDVQQVPAASRNAPFLPSGPDAALTDRWPTVVEVQPGVGRSRVQGTSGALRQSARTCSAATMAALSAIDAGTPASAIPPLACP